MEIPLVLRKLTRNKKNYCSRQYKKERQRFYNNLNLKDYTENKVFWKMVKPFLSDKSNSSNKTTLVEDDEIISEDKKVSEICNSYFADTVEQLDVGENIFLLNLTGDSLDPIETIIKGYDLHPSILGIKEHVNKEVFSFSNVSLQEIEFEIKCLNNAKANTHKSIPVKNLKENIDSIGTSLHRIIQQAIENSYFQDKLKLAEISPTTKRGNY